MHTRTDDARKLFSWDDISKEHVSLLFYTIVSHNCKRAPLCGERMTVCERACVLQSEKKRLCHIERLKESERKKRNSRKHSVKS